MRINRSKVIRKCLKFFRIVYNFHEPYDILLDGNFITECLEFKIDIYDRLCKLLQCTEVKLHIFESALESLRKGGDKTLIVYEFAKSRCAVIEDTDLSGDTPSIKLASFQRKIHEEFLSSSSKTKIRRFIVATQNGEVRTILRSIPGVAILYANKVTLLLETPSEVSKKFNSKIIEGNKVALNNEEKEVVSKAKLILEKRSIKDSCVDIPKLGEYESRKRKALSPNPLSCKPTDESSHRNKKRKESMFKRRK